MYNYLAYLFGGLSKPGESPAADGAAMVRQCIEQLEATGNPEQFPPRLLILLTSPAYSNEAGLREMLFSIRQNFAEYKQRKTYLQLPEALEVPLVGSSVAAVIFDRQIHSRGALLVCLASRMIEAEAAASLNVCDNHDQAISHLLDQLNLGFPVDGDFGHKPVVDRLLLTFFPSQGGLNDGLPYIAPDLHRLLRQQMFTRTPIIGGVAASPGFQFANDEVLHSALVAARVFSGVPYASSIGHGLTETEFYLRIRNLADDQRTVLTFDRDGIPAELLGLKKQDDFALLGELSLNRDPLVTVARLAPNNHHIRMLRTVNPNDLFKLLEINTDNMIRKVNDVFEDARKKQMLEKPIGCLAFHCAARRETTLDFTEMINDAEKVMDDQGLYLGGFFDGEAGVDEIGRYLFGNWCVSTLCFGDEMRERTYAYTGFKAISDAAQPMTSAASLNEVLEYSLKVIFNTGLRSAMISLVMKNNNDEWLVAKRAIGSRYSSIVEVTQRIMSEGEILATIINNGKPEFISESRADPRCDLKAVQKSGTISQYILRLVNKDGTPIALLQIDLGDLRRRGSDLYDVEHRLLQSLGSFVGANILRVMNREEADRALKLDDVLKESLRAESRDEALRIFIAGTAEYFEVGMLHIRLPVDTNLQLIAGQGEYYDKLKLSREKIPIYSESPTARAFRDNKSIVVNLAQDDRWHRGLIAFCHNEPDARKVCEQVNSYANVPIWDSKGQPIGTISLLSFEKWFFTHARVRTLDSLSQRIGYLFEHFRRKEEEKDYRDRKFLLEIGSDFVRTADFSKPHQAIDEAVKRLRKAANAEIASLFIWDREADRYILRAQDGWAEPEWVDAARYYAGERWTGQVANAESPQYLPNLYAYKIKHALVSERSYAQMVFGRKLTSDFFVEAIGLPLRTSENRPLGVLTLYRQYKPNQLIHVTGFTTIDPIILQEAADTMSAMLQLLLGKLHVVWYKKEVSNRKAVRNAMESSHKQLRLEKRLCRQMIKSFYTIRADLYLPLNNGEINSLRLVASDFLPEGSGLSPDTHLIMKAAQTRKIQEKHHAVSTSKWQDLKSAKTEGLIERICLPLVHEQYLVGVLDLHCRLDRKRSHLRALHDPQQLTELAAEIALVYLQQQKLELTEKRRLTVQAMGAMVFSSSHRLMNLVQNIRSNSVRIKLASSDVERHERLAGLLEIISPATEHVKRTMNVARQMREIKLQPHQLHDLIVRALSEFDREIQEPKLILQSKIDKHTIVHVDSDLIHEAFRNIIHNAIKSMPDGGHLAIEQQLCAEQNQLRVIFSDTGVGMSKEQKQAALEGFVIRQDSIGMGVHVSVLLMRALNGDLEIESEENKGTQVTVTLPAGRGEVML